MDNKTKPKRGQVHIFSTGQDDRENDGDEDDKDGREKQLFHKHSLTHRVLTDEYSAPKGTVTPKSPTGHRAQETQLSPKEHIGTSGRASARKPALLLITALRDLQVYQHIQMLAQAFLPNPELLPSHLTVVVLSTQPQDQLHQHHQEFPGNENAQGLILIFRIRSSGSQSQ